MLLSVGRVCGKVFGWTGRLIRVAKVNRLAVWRRSSSSATAGPRRRDRQRAVLSRPGAIGAFEPLESRQLLSVTFHGGAVLPHVETQAVYLGSDWSASDALKSQSASVDQFLSYLVHSPYMDMLTSAGYGVGQGSASGGIVVGSPLNKSAGISDSQIRAALQSAISSGQLTAPDANRLYLVYVEPGVVVRDGTATSASTFLGYHGAFAGRNAAGKSADIRYAVIPYPGSPNPSAASQGYASVLDQFTSVTSHELAEAVTDPDGNYTLTGWYDDQRDGEIGDLTRINTVLNGYLVQDVVDKNDRPIAPVTTGSGSSLPGSSTPSTPTTPSTPPKTSLIAPQNVVAKAVSSSTVQLSWSAVGGTQGYRIYLWNGARAVFVGTVGASTTAVQIAGFAPGTTARLIVEAFSGDAVADSAMVSATTTARVRLPSIWWAPWYW